MPTTAQKPPRHESTEEIVKAITQKMRDTYREIGRSLIPLLGNSPEDLQALLELGEVYEKLGCTEDAVTAYASMKASNASASIRRHPQETRNHELRSRQH